MTAQPLTYVATIGDRPIAAGTDQTTLMTYVVTTATRYSLPDRTVRWNPHAPDVWRLMSRAGGRGRWSWTQYAVHVVPTVIEPAAGGETR